MDQPSQNKPASGSSGARSPASKSDCEQNTLASASDFPSSPFTAPPSSSPTAPADAQLPIEVLGEYKLLELIGAGGMGRVYRAQHLRMERIVALKILPASAVCDAALLERFHREVKTAARLFHPNIVTAFDAGNQGDLHYLVMEHVEGRSMSELVEQDGPLPVATAIDYILQAARGLHYAHQHNVIHRDIKPNNLIVSAEGVVKVLDMGLARLESRDPKADARLTLTGVVMGTAGYMSPEQATDASQVDVRSDIYSLGCTLYFLLTSRPVYAGDLVQTLIAHVQKPVPSLLAARDDVSPRLNGLFQTMLAKAPADRPQSMAETIAALTACAAELAQDSRAGENVGRIGVALEDTVLRQASLSTNRAHFPAVGLKLGALSCAVAHLDDQRNPATIPTAEGANTTPAALFLQNCTPPLISLADSSFVLNDQPSRILIGKAALEIELAQADRVVGGHSGFFRDHLAAHTIDGHDYPPEVLAAFLVRRLLSDAGRLLPKIPHAVFAIPSRLTEIDRARIQDAGFLAGLKRVDLLDHALAAAIWYGQQRDFLESTAKADPPQTLVVIYESGGAFEVAVIEWSPGRLRVLAVASSDRLGSLGVDERCMQWIGEQVKTRFGIDPSPAAVARLWRKWEAAKRALASHETTELTLEHGGRTLRIAVTREMLLRRINDLLAAMRQLVEETLAEAGVDWPGVDHLLVFGGASHLPVLGEMLRALVAKKPTVLAAGDQVAAQGAAVYAGEVLRRMAGGGRFEITPRAALDLGVWGMDKHSGQHRVAVVSPRSSPLPTTVRRTFQTSDNPRQPVVLRLVQGDAARPEECRWVGAAEMPNTRPGHPVVFEFRLDVNGRLEAYGQTHESEAPTRLVLQRPTELSPHQLYAWREWLDTMLLCHSK